ncbi:MAG: hypothetical protein AAB546_00825 [Patescibacteria group bacterium]
MTDNAAETSGLSTQVNYPVVEGQEISEEEYKEIRKRNSTQLEDDIIDTISIPQSETDSVVIPIFEILDESEKRAKQAGEELAKTLYEPKGEDEQQLVGLIWEAHQAHRDEISEIHADVKISSFLEMAKAEIIEQSSTPDVYLRTFKLPWQIKKLQSLSGKPINRQRVESSWVMNLDYFARQPLEKQWKEVEIPRLLELVKKLNKTEGQEDQTKPSFMSKLTDAWHYLERQARTKNPSTYDKERWVLKDTIGINNSEQYDQAFYEGWQTIAQKYQPEEIQ